MAADLLDVRIAECAVHQIDRRGAHGRALALRHQLDALRSGIGALVELARQIFRCEHEIRAAGQLFADSVELRLGEDAPDRAAVHRLLDVLDVVAVEHAQSLQPRDAEKVAQLRGQRARLVVIAGLFFHIEPVNHRHSSIPSAASARAPMSVRMCIPSKRTCAAAM